MDQKTLEAKLLKQMLKIIGSKQEVALGFRPKEIFMFISAIQFTRKNAAVGDMFKAELLDLEDFLKHILTVMLPSCEQVINAGSMDALDVKNDGTPVDPELFKAALQALAKRGKPNVQ